MSRRLPPLNSLRAFEAAARHLSFKDAAEELNVTPAAVSQQVRTLEDACATRLFRRLTRALELTETGRAAAPILSEGFDRLAEGAEALFSRRPARVITVSTAPSFGAKWLLPRLERFRERYPDYDVRIDASDTPVRFQGDGVDIALRYGTGHYPDLEVHCLMGQTTIPVCAPSLLDLGPPLDRPDDLRRHTLLHVEWTRATEGAPSWRMWLKAAGAAGVDADRGPRFSNESMALSAAVDGQGVALIGSVLAADDLAAGRLVRPFPAAAEQAAVFRYYVVHPPGQATDPRVEAFRDWVIAEAAQTGATD